MAARRPVCSPGMSSPSLSDTPGTLDAAATAARLPWPALADEIAAVLRDTSVQVPARIVQPLAHGGSLFVMPAADDRVAMTKLITLTPANAGSGRATIQGDVVLRALPPANAFIAAVGAFTPAMAELAPALCQQMAQQGRIVVDTEDAAHEAGDLLQAGLDVAALPALGDVLQRPRTTGGGPVLFKSCGWAGWDLAAARLAMRQGVVQ